MPIKQNVIMTQKLQNGIKLFLLVSFLTFNSCKSTLSLSQYNFFNGSKFFNDVLGVNGAFFGDVKFNNPKKVKAKKLLNQINAKISFKDLLVYGEAVHLPKYEVFLFLKKNKSKKSNSNDIKILIDNSDENTVLLERILPKYNVFVLIKAKGKHKSNNSIMQDAKSIIKSISVGKKNNKDLSYSDIFNNYKNEDNLLFVLDKFENAPVEKNKKNEWIKLQYLLTILSHDNDYVQYKEQIKNFEEKRKDRLSKILDTIISAKKDSFNIVKQIGNKILSNDKVVILNEMHWKPEHRLLAHKLLPKLKEKGFNYLAIEAIYKNKDSILNTRGYPLKSTGFYTSEPYFGLLIRKAIKLGFRIVGYDDFDSNDRELTQAKNIKSIIDKDKNAKVFVYCGIDHIIEKNNKDSNKRMAQLLKEMTKIDPITIDQTKLVYNSKKSFLFNSKTMDNKSLINANVDYFLINNMKATIEAVYPNSNVKEIEMTHKSLLKNEGKEVFTSVYLKNEYDKYKSSSIPIIKKIKSIKNGKLKISIPKGDFILLVKDNLNNILIKKEIYLN